MVEQEILACIGKLIRQKRHEQGLQHEEFAQQLGIAASALIKLERGQETRTEIIITATKALGMELAYNVLFPSEKGNFVPAPLPDTVEAGVTIPGTAWTPLGPARKDRYRHAHILCQCECGKIAFVELNRINQDRSQDCGCNRKAKIAAAAEEKALTTPRAPKEDLRGETFGNLLVLDKPPRLNNGKWEWLCRCLLHPDSDPVEKWFRGTKLKNGEVTSCGCQRGKSRKVPNLDGQVFGFMKASDTYTVDPSGHTLLRCRCIVCGRVRYLRAEQLTNHSAINCLHCTPSDLTGVKAGRYVVIGATRTRNGYPEILCRYARGRKPKNANGHWIKKIEILQLLAERMQKERNDARKKSTHQ